MTEKSESNLTDEASLVEGVDENGTTKVEKSSPSADSKSESPSVSGLPGMRQAVLESIEKAFGKSQGDAQLEMDLSAYEHDQN